MGLSLALKFNSLTFRQKLVVARARRPSQEATNKPTNFKK
jgi:hypothetical protein